MSLDDDIHTFGAFLKKGKWEIVFGNDLNKLLRIISVRECVIIIIFVVLIVIVEWYVYELIVFLIIVHPDVIVIVDHL
jgi:hypothetical protein